MPALDILLPTYNGASYLEKQVRSIQEQSFKDWRLLICDDGSNDTTVEIAYGLVAHDNRIEIIPSSGNMGQQHRLLGMISRSKSDLIGFADQDDVWAVDKLELLVESCREYDLCFGSSRLIDKKGQELGRDLGDSIPPPYRAGDKLTWLFRPLVSAHALIGRRDLFNRLIFARTLPFDWLLSVEAAFNDSLCYVPEARTYHRLHGANQSNGMFAEHPKPPRLIGRSATVGLPRAVQRERLHFLSMLEHLCFAQSLSPDLQRRAKKAHTACFRAWYWHQGWINNLRVGRFLPEQIEAILRPFAGSDEDWNYFKIRFDALSLPLMSPVRLLTRKRRLAIEWPS